MKRTVFNEKATGHQTKNYPLFLGEELGVYDTANRNYPSLHDLYNRQVAQIWYSTEVDITRDRIDLLQAPSDVVDMMMLNLKWQTAMDSVASRSIDTLLGKHVSNPEMSSLIRAWSFFEDIHGQTYSDIISNVFPNPSSMIEEIMQNEDVIKRTKVLVKLFDDMYNLPDNAPVSEKRKALIRVATAFYAMESISFMSSFTATFSIVNNYKRFVGIGERVRFVCRDELLHALFSYEILRIMRDEEKYPEWEEMKPEMQNILDSIVSVERVWNDYLTKDRNVLGITKEFLDSAVDFFATPSYIRLGLTPPFEPLYENPVSHLDKFFDTSLIQTASQEIQQTGYKIGSLIDDNLRNIDFTSCFEGIKGLTN